MVQTWRELTWAESHLRRPRGRELRAGWAQRCPGGTGHDRGEEGPRQGRGGATTGAGRDRNRGEEGLGQGQGGAMTGARRGQDKGEEAP